MAEKKTVPKALFVGTTSELGLEDLKRIIGELKAEGYWIEECSFQAHAPLITAFRDGLSSQITEMLQEICPDVQVTWIDDSLPREPCLSMTILDEADELPDGLDYQDYPSKEHEGT